MLARLIPRFDWQEKLFRLMSRLQRRKWPEALPIELDRQRVYILPTRFGLFFGLFLIVMLMGALNYNNSLALMLTFLLGSLTLLSPLYTVRNLTGLRLLQASAQPAFAGETAHFVLTLMNPSSKARPVIWGQLEGEARFCELSANGIAELTVEQSTRQRGWLPLKRVRLYTSYPLGLFFAWAWLQPATRVLVYPKPEGGAPQPPDGANPASGRPERSGDEEWSGLRRYRPGDPSRVIAWKVLARTDQMMSKTFSDHRSEELVFDFDALSGLDREQRLSRLARWVLDAQARNERYTLQLPGQRIGPGSGDQHRHRCLKALAEYPGARGDSS